MTSSVCTFRKLIKWSHSENSGPANSRFLVIRTSESPLCIYLYIDPTGGMLVVALNIG